MELISLSIGYIGADEARIFGVFINSLLPDKEM
jgi:hypothetical protein